MTPLTFFMIAVTTVGSPQSMTLLCAVLVLFLWTHKKYNHLWQFVMFMSLGALSVWILKNTLQIPRPVGGLIEETGYGFPSGHATMATLFVGLVLFSYMSHIRSFIGRWLFALLGIGFVLLISYSRLYLGVHTIGQVAGGMLLGIFWLILSIDFYRCVRKRRMRTLTSSPVIQ